MKRDSVWTYGLIMIGLLALAQGGFAADQWTNKEAMPTARLWLSTSVVDGQVYAIGGSATVAGPTLSAVEVYDPGTNTWTKKADMPFPRAGISTSAVNGKIYVMGGWREDTVLSTVEMYDPMTDTWESKADMLTARAFFSTSVVNGKLYAIGGTPTRFGPVLETVEVYDPGTDTWMLQTNMLTPRAGTFTSVVNGHIYVIGGVAAIQGPPISTVEAYHPETGTWTSKADMPTARTALSTSAVGEKIYAIGGTETIEGPIVGDGLRLVEEYDVVTDTWTEKQRMRTARLFFSTSTVNGYIYAFGGVATGLGPAGLTEVEEYDTGFVPSLTPAWDVNLDGAVNIFDLVTVALQFGKIGVGLKGDINSDGVVNVLDLVLVASHFGESTLVAAPSVVTLKRMMDTSVLETEQIQRALGALRAVENPSRNTLVAIGLLNAWLKNTPQIVTETKLLDNYPNPFNPETWIPYQLASGCEVIIRIYDMNGKQVRQLDIGVKPAGLHVSRDHAAYWDGHNDTGELVSSGVYFYQMLTPDFSAVRKAIVLK